MPQKLSFALIQLRSGLTPLTAPNPITATDLGPTTAVANRALAVIVGDGDQALETDETGHVLAAAAASNAVLLAGLNGAEDPVRITAHGRIDAGSVGALTGDGPISFSNDWGFGLRNGSESSVRRLNSGDSLTWQLNPAGGELQALQRVSFVVDRAKATTPAEIALDVDGDVVASGAYAAAQNGANANAALRFSAAPNSLVEIDFLDRLIAVNGVALAQTQTAAFFRAFDASAKDTITIGAITAAGFSVRDLQLHVGPAPAVVNLPPSVSLANVFEGVAEDVDLSSSLRVADIVVTDDGRGSNVLSLDGADADFFEIVGDGLFLKAGAALDFKSKPTLDVIVSVDDQSIGATPDAEAALSLAVRPGGSLYSFAHLQLQRGIVPSTASEPLSVADIGGTKTVANRAVAVLRGDGDPTLELGETAYVLAAAASSNGTSGLDALNGANDPVRITAHGRIDAGTVGTLGGDAMSFSSSWGFGLRNGVESSLRWLNSGDSLTWQLNPVDGEHQVLRGVRFVVDRSTATTAAEIALDVDGDVLASGTYAAAQNGANTNAALRFSAAPGALVEIDFQGRSVAVNGTVLSETETAAFFAAFDASARDSVTIGAVKSTGFSVRDLQLNAGRVAIAENLPPSVSLENVLSEVAEDTELSLPLRVADIVVTDDGLGVNLLWVAGADADLFEIVGNALFLKAGTVLDFETRPSLDVTVQVDDATVGATPDATVSLTLAVTDVDENAAPTAVVLTNQVNALAEGAFAAAVKVADIVVFDDLIGVNTLSLSGVDADAFEIIGTELFLKAGTVLDFETKMSLEVSIEVDDVTVGASPDASAAFTLSVTDVAERFGELTLDGSLVDWAPETRLDNVLVDGAQGFGLYGTYQSGAFVFAISAEGAAIGPNTTIWLNTDLDVSTGYAIFGVTGLGGAEYNINLGSDGRAALYTGAAGETLVADSLAYAFDAGRNTLEIALPSGLMAGSPTKADLYIDINDSAFLPNDYSRFSYRVGENAAPSVSLMPILTALRENADTSAAIEIADIVVTDDGIGVNTLLLAGADSDAFEIVGAKLFLKAGATLDFETKSSFEVTVAVDDANVGTSPDGTASLSLAIADVNENYGTIWLDGSLLDWASDMRLDRPFNDPTTNEVYGAFQSDAFVLGLRSTIGPIGPNTTIWFNTDLNTSTGYQIFGNSFGAEFNVNFGDDGVARLYTGAAGQTLVEANLDYRLNADRTVLEIALPSEFLGDSRRVNVAIDINDQISLPSNFTNYIYRVREAPTPLAVDPTLRIAIVYSETSADYYFDKTAYGQLFLAAQSQAMQAGIPFDILSEDDLTDIANLVGYDAIVFPGLSHVQSSRLGDITEALRTAVEDYKIGLVAMGNFLTNDETGSAIAGDSYARMKMLLGVTLAGFGATGGVTIRASDDPHPVNDRFASSETVGTYNNNSYLTFTYDQVAETGSILFEQIVNGLSLPAVVATQTGGRNVHFATDAAFGNNNILAEAIRWSVNGEAPEVGLQMTRFESLFFSRNDMDLSQEYFDVALSEPSIYDAMNAIVAQWYQDYGFVGSYYVNIGANPPDNQTIWDISLPYYQQLLAMESEIGTHSWTHPYDTNFLLKEGFTAAEWEDWLAATTMIDTVRSQITSLGAAGTQTLMNQLLAQTDPRLANPVDPGSLIALQREVLAASYRFQFEYSLLELEKRLGIDLGGGAVPGAPEKLPASLEILKYLDYMTGGYSAAGAGYPGAFGFLNPDYADKVYFAPNVSFDFSLIGFRGLTAAEAEAVWAAEYAAILDRGTTPIVHFPWHDYGPTNWAEPGAPDAGYTLAMFTNFIARAAADGAEFVTGIDLAKRIEDFVASDIEVRQAEGRILVETTGSDNGKFSLEVKTGAEVIANVGNWYAFDGDRVFLPKNGGTFSIELGSQADDVTRIAALPMRAELLSAVGDGSNLDFSLNGRGDAKVDLQSLANRSVIVTGADSWSLSGEMLTLNFAAIDQHSVAIQYTDAQQVSGSNRDDFIIGSNENRTIFGGFGNDLISGGRGADEFVFRTSDGNDTVLNFDGQDRIHLVGSSFESADDALAAFTSTMEGLTLRFSDNDSIFFAGLEVGQLRLDQIILSDSLFV